MSSYFDFQDCSIKYSVTGKGSYIFLIHGFPTSSKTWRFIVPELSKSFKLVCIDLPGLGDSRFNSQTNLSIKEQAARIVIFINSFKCDSFSVIGHNSGGAIARLIALNMGKKAKNLVLINTEIPNHRPPWIPFYQKIGQFPTSNFILKNLLYFNWFNLSSAGFKELYYNKEYFLKGYLNIYIEPLKKSLVSTNGAINFLKGIDWDIVDDFEYGHQNIQARVLLLWGENDKTFPLKEAIKMQYQFENAQLAVISESCLLPHEEKPLESLLEITKFLPLENEK